MRPAAAVVGVLVIALGALMMGASCHVAFAIGIEDGEYQLMPQDREGITIGAFITAMGSVLTIVSIVAVIRFGDEEAGSAQLLSFYRSHNWLKPVVLFLLILPPNSYSPSPCI